MRRNCSCISWRFLTLWIIILLIYGVPTFAQWNDTVPDSTLAASADSLIFTPIMPQAPRKVFEDPDTWFARDKALHLSISAGLVGVLYQGDRHVLDMSVGRSRWVASLSTLTIGAIKELRDHYHPHSTASFRDLAADSAGILIGVLLFSYVTQ